jgi:uncharacterized protein (DUF2164 family)
VDARLAQRAQVGGLIAMSIELPKEVREQAVASLQRYVETELDERFGNLAAGSLLGFFLKEIAPSVYNQAVTDVQDRIQMRVTEIDIEVFEEPFGYWTHQGKEGKKR